MRGLRALILAIGALLLWLASIADRCRCWLASREPATRWAIGSAAVFITITVLLLLTNSEVGYRDNLNRPMPFLAGYVLTLLLLLTMTIETPITHDRRWWQVWRIYDPLSMVLFGFLFAIGVYLFGVYGNFSGRFRLRPDAFDWARFVLYLSAVSGFLVLPYVITQAWKRVSSKRRRRTALTVGCYCYGMVLVGWIFHEVSVGFATTMIGLGTLSIAVVWWWERRRGGDREVLL